MDRRPSTSNQPKTLVKKDALKKLRDVDDKIVYALNASVPSPSFRKEINPESSCKDLFSKLQESHSKREKAIQNCIKVTSEKIATLKQDSEGSLAAVKHLNKEQTKLRLLRSELGVEEVVRDRSLKLYYERCRGFFKPPNLELE